MIAKAPTLAFILTTAYAGSLPHLHGRSPFPDVTIKALPAGCANYPTGTWSLTATDAGNPDVDDLGSSAVYSIAIGSRGPVMRVGRIALNAQSWLARRAFQCNTDTQKVEVLADTSVNAAGAPGDTKFTPVALSAYPYDAELLYLVDGDQPTLYEHYIGEEKQPNKYLGGFDTTTWGAEYYEADSTSYDLPYYQLRLLPEGQGLQDNETRIFLKIQE